MITKRSVMSELGSASGCVNRCLDIIAEYPTAKLTQARLVEIVGKLQKADKAILFVAHEIDKLEDG